MMAGDGETEDAAEIGRAMAFPHGLREQLAGIAADEEPVRRAARAVWAVLDDLQLVTAALNGSTAGVRVAAAGKAVGPVVAGTGEMDETKRVAESFSRPDLVVRMDDIASDDGVAKVRMPPASVGNGVRESIPSSNTVTATVVVGSVGTGTGGSMRYAASDGVEPGAAPVLRGTQAGVGQASADGAATEPESGGLQAGLVSRGLVMDVTQEAGSAPARASDESGGSAVLTSDAAPVVRSGLRADVAAALSSRQGAPPVASGSDVVMGRLEIGSTFTGNRRRGPLPGSAAPSGDGFQGGLDAGNAPQPPERGSDGMGGGGGAVMMDGRLVGQWLSDRMAMDAARPGAGTTFFDPRQSPAWTPSGAV